MSGSPLGRSLRRDLHVRLLVRPGSSKVPPSLLGGRGSCAFHERRSPVTNPHSTRLNSASRSASPAKCSPQARSASDGTSRMRACDPFFDPATTARLCSRFTEIFPVSYGPTLAHRLAPPSSNRPGRDGLVVSSCLVISPSCGSTDSRPSSAARIPFLFLPRRERATGNPSRTNRLPFCACQSPGPFSGPDDLSLSIPVTLLLFSRNSLSRRRPPKALRHGRRRPG